MRLQKKKDSIYILHYYYLNVKQVNGPLLMTFHLDNNVNNSFLSLEISCSTGMISIILAYIYLPLYQLVVYIFDIYYSRLFS